MLVGAFACAHTPQLLARPSTEDRDLVLRVHAAFARVKRRLEAIRADAIAIVAGDHVEAFFLDGVPALAVYVGTECAGAFGRYRYRFPIHEPLSRAVVERGVERGFDLFYTQHAQLDYAFYVPLHFTMPEFEYDRRLLETLKAGHGRELALITGEELDKMGNIELRTWATVLGAVGDAKADVYCYEPSWHHGNAVVEWPL